MFIFTFTSVIGCYTVSGPNVRVIRDNKKTILLMHIVIIIVVFVAAICIDVTIADNISDTFMAVMGAVNMTIVALLNGKMFETYADYERQKREDIEQPEFHKSTLSDPAGVIE